MKARIRRGIDVVAVVTSVAAMGVAATTGTSSAQPARLQVYAITSDGRTMGMFFADQTDRMDWVRAVVGLSGDTGLIGIDFRVQNRTMYGVGNRGGIYTIQTPPDADPPRVSKVSQLTVALSGTNFGVDFNPAADRLRIISDTGQNLRHNLNDNTTIEDGILSTPPDYGPTRGNTAAAYTNNDLNPSTATTLYDINTATDQLVIQSPPNPGFLNPVGALGVDAGSNAGLDIFSDLTNGKTTSVTAYAVLIDSDGFSSFYGINLSTGEATSLGQLPLLVSDIAVMLDTP